MSARDSLKELMTRLRPFLKAYLESKNIRPNKAGFYKCINPAHADKNPSSRLVPPDEVNLFCFGCLFNADLFRAASVLEGRPSSGPEFVTENVQYLAEQFNVPFTPIELTEDDLIRMQVRNLYGQAEQLLVAYNNPLHAKELYGWDLENVAKWGIGTVPSWKEFVDQLAQTTGYTKSFINANGIRENEFNEHSLTFAIKDHNGNTVGFAARDSRWKEGSSRYNKWSNTPQSIVYNKSEVLYGIDAAKHYPQTFVFEGYGDVIEARLQGMLNCVGLCGIAFTSGQLSLLKRLQKRELVLALDNDQNQAGDKAVADIVDKHFSGKECFKVSIVDIPRARGQKSSDPRSYINKHGIQEFKGLEIKDIFKWRLDKFSDDSDSNLVCEVMLPLVLNEPRHYVREDQIKLLADRTGKRLKALTREYERLLELSKGDRKKKMTRELQVMAERAELVDADDVISVVNEHLGKIRTIDQETSRIDVLSEIETIDFVDKLVGEFDNLPEGLMGWYTGFSFWDDNILGMPKKECIVALAGLENIGKTAMVAQLCWQIVTDRRNKGIKVLVFTIDDSRAQFMPRLIANDTNLPLQAITNPKAIHDLTDADRAKIQRSWGKLRTFLGQRRLDIKDVNHGSSVAFMTRWVEKVREEDSNSDVLIFLDNFHKLSGGASPRADEKTRTIGNSMAIDELTKNYQVTVFCTMELRKHEAGKATGQDLLNTIQLAYDNNITLQMDQELHRDPQSDLYWQKGDNRYPVNKLWCEKNKFSGWKGEQWLNFWPDRSKFFEAGKPQLDGGEIKEDSGGLFNS